MFENDKQIFVTKAIAEQLSAEHQFFIYQYIQEYHAHLTDYLQIFEFYLENSEQWLIQRQEEPNRETTIDINLEVAEPINRKVWVMDQGEHIMILFPEDY